MIEELFGINALKKRFESFLTTFQIGRISMGQEQWIGKNFQFKSPVCPHYQLVELCAEAMEIRKDKLGSFCHFCGIAQKDIMVGGLDCRRKEVGGIEQLPFCACGVITDLMEIAIEVAKFKKPELVRKISESPDEKEKKKVRNYLAILEAFEIGQKILTKWKFGIPRIILMEKEFSDINLILKVENLQEQLKNQAVDGCKQAPKRDHNQWLYID